MWTFQAFCRFCIKLAALAVIVSGQAIAGTPDKLNWCLDHFPGFHEFHGSSRVPVGPSVDMMQELARRAGMQLQIDGKTPSSRCLKDLASGATDIMTNLLYSPTRAADITMIRFGSRFPDRLYLAANDPRHIDSLSQLSTVSLVTVRGFGLHPTIQQVVDALPVEQKQQVKSTETALQMVIKGRADATLLPPVQVQQIFRQQPELAKQLREISFDSKQVKPQDVYLGLAKHGLAPGVEDKLRRALTQMQQDGSLQRLYAGKMLQ